MRGTPKKKLLFCGNYCDYTEQWFFFFFFFFFLVFLFVCSVFFLADNQLAEVFRVQCSVIMFNMNFQMGQQNLHVDRCMHAYIDG